MTTISPTRVSMYDFLYQDLQPMISLLADTANLSLPQTRIAVTSSLQAILGALLGYQQRYQSQAVSKKLFSRAAVKELRQYNAMNFATLNATLYHRHDVTETLFINSGSINEACDHIAAQIKATAPQIKILLSNLTIIVLRELAILADYSQLDNEELDKWFALQPQFLSLQRFDATEQLTQPNVVNNTVDDSNNVDDNVSAEANISNSDETVSRNSKQQSSHSQVVDTIITPAVFDHYWYELSNFKPEYDSSVQDMQQATSNYLKVIGRSTENRQTGRHNDLLVFTEMPTIALPHQRWLLQLAKISDIYLSRYRLRINSEPDIAPTRPLVSLSLLTSNSEDTLATTSEKPIEYDKPKPLWKNSTIILTIVVIAVLGALAFIKYQVQQTNSAATTSVVAKDENIERTQQDVAIVKIDEEASEVDGTAK